MNFTENDKLGGLERFRRVGKNLSAPHLLATRQYLDSCEVIKV